MEKIVAAACYYQGLTYSLPAPGRHHDVLRLMPAPESHLCEQGFLTSAGRFLDRTMARSCAIDNKQIKDMNILHSRHLFSEDLW